MKLLFYSIIILFSSLTASVRAGLVSYTPDASTDFTNPERGWYVTMYNYGNGISQNNNLSYASWQGQVSGGGNATGDTHQVVVKRIYDLGGIYGGTDYASSGQPIDGTWLNNLSNDLNTARSLGLKLIIRFDYNEGSGTGNSGNSGGQDASLSVIQGHINQIFPILAANEDVIAYIEAGFIGQWGEWHDSTNNLSGNDSNSTSQESQVLTWELAALPTDRMIAVRYPGYTLEIFSTTSPITAANAFNGSNYSRVGTHDDCFEVDQWDGGTYAKGTNLGWSAGQFKSFLAAQNYSVQEGGETCGTSGYSTCSNSLADLQSEHWSAMHCEWDPSNIQEWSSGGCLSQINLDLGYRYVLTQSTVPASVNVGAVLNLSFVVENNGWANCYNQRGLEVILRPSGDSGFSGAIAIPVTESAADNTDPRFWQPGQSYTADVSVTLPPSVTAGIYSVLLNLPDGHSSLYNSASSPASYIDYAIRLADGNGMWESSDGYNNLSQTLSVVDCPACTATPTPSNTATPAPGTGTDISINFVGGSSNGDPTNMAAATDAGVQSLPDWNNTGGASGSLTNLMDNTGGTTGSTLGYSAGNAIWSLPISYSTGDFDMMGGYIDASSGASTTVTISSLPSRITANGYSVYVYFDGDNSSATRTGNYTIGSTTISGTDAANTNFSGTFTQASGGSNGNYVLFTNQSGSSFTLTASVGASSDAYPRAPINGIQIVANPSSGTASPTATRTTLSTATATATETFTRTSTSTPSGTLTPFPADTLSDSPTKTGTPSPTNTFTTISRASSTASPAISVTASPTITPSSSATFSASASATPFYSPTRSATLPLNVSQTDSPTCTLSPSQSPSPTPSATNKSSSSATWTPSATESPSASARVSDSPTPEPSLSASPSATASAYESPTPSDTPGVSRSATTTNTPTARPSRSATPSATAPSSPSPRPSATPSATVSAPVPTPPPSGGPNKILATSPVPDPNPIALKILLAGEADSVTVEIYSMALVWVATASVGPSETAWISLPLPSAFLEKAANGLYYYRVVSRRGSSESRTAGGRFLILH